MLETYGLLRSIGLFFQNNGACLSRVIGSIFDHTSIGTENLQLIGSKTLKNFLSPIIHKYIMMGIKEDIDG